MQANIATLENEFEIKNGNNHKVSFKPKDLDDDFNDNEIMKSPNQKKDFDFIDKHIIRTIRGGN